jgi:hypothetical protein
MPSPPIIIGELHDVPAADSPIASSWAQEASRRIVHRFVDATARDAAYPAGTAGVGAVCEAANVLYLSNGTTWLPIAPQSAVDALTASTRRMGCQVQGPSGSTGSGSLATLQYTSELEDTDNLFNPATPTIVTLPADGIWAASINMQLNTAYNGTGSIDLLQNGGIPSVFAADFHTGAVQATIVRRCFAGSTFAARFLIVTASLTVSWVNTTLDVWRIST